MRDDILGHSRLEAFEVVDEHRTKPFLTTCEWKLSGQNTKMNDNRVLFLDK